MRKYIFLTWLLFLAIVVNGQNATTSKADDFQLFLPPPFNIAYVDPVNGDDANSGTQLEPFRTISKAISTKPSCIRIAKGFGTENNICNLSDNLIIEGGYVRSGSLGQFWSKSDAVTDKTIVTFCGQENAPDCNNAIRHLAAFKSDGKSGWAVKNLSVVTANAPAGMYANDGRGMSNYGFLIINSSSGYTISNVDITVGSAGAGANGKTPGAGGGSAGGAGGIGGVGTNGFGNSTCTGSKGGRGTVGSGIGSGNNDNCGTAAFRMNTGCPGLICPGTGGNGSAGANGKNGSDGSTGKPGSISYTYYMPGAAGSSGENGGGGQGGGGGAGSTNSLERVGSDDCTNSNLCGSISGGAGGDGGQGGSGGSGGFGGGGAFGIYVSSNSSVPVMSEVYIHSLPSKINGGTGGDGSTGLPGSNPGNNGISTYCVATSCTYSSGSGGVGGAGGKGGHGGSGAAGDTAFYVLNGVRQIRPAGSTGNSINENLSSALNVHPAQLPVDLVAFTCLNEGSAFELKWSTAAEYNTAKFIVEKSSNATDWSYLGEVPAVGNSDKICSYDLTDENPFVGNNFYRMKVVDKDLNSSYSNAVQIRFNKDIINGFLSVYPNPVVTPLNVDIQSVDNQVSKIKVMDVWGKTVYEQSLILDEGVNHIYMNLNNLSNGMYILSYTDSKGKEHQYKLMKE